MNKIIKIALILSISTAIYAESDTTLVENSLKSYAPETDVQLANKLTALGSLKQKTRDYEGAISFYDQSLALRTKMGDKESQGYALVLYLKSISEFRLGKSCQALENIKEVIQVYQKIGDLDSALHAEEEGLKKYQEACGLVMGNQQSLTFNKD
ncbi:tetratricopeptide repeat protein [Leptospira wolffii]|uniref:tetratricopeptide repeat protein n=1 Tax=Leptospira wolffii TaxID=409998 RepID=UPI0010841214|nr:tetratricopeptide repeat protein [Leptospira wolffii]TGK55259.1 tetratricopeptide repeat protein [Leptospira wolffii]TGK65768.1 tetratricopeptide repeat protein [Leptospira wolffii]TGK70440.1 tetratricopeptide repeat protein [Leptospira wolffii]TGL30024.1 tetratricopeptide repeat protein [Leptospira wolffii]